MGFSGKVVIVTGGGSGMGRLACRMMSARGARVAAFDVNEEGLAETASTDPSIHARRVDVTDAAAVSAAVREVSSSLGPVHRVYNAAAIMPFGRLIEQDNATIHRVMAINYGGLVNIAQATVPDMVKRGEGDFISFSSMSGIIPTLLTGAYNASKFAVSAFSEILYHENRASGVRFACVCPPPVATPLLKQGWDTVMPKTVSNMPPLEPQVVLDSIEVALAKGEFWVFPGKGTRFGYIMRRLFPDLIWKDVHKNEGF
ncbi:MAG: SDR family oxidoreductase [Gammaproteobacteria bacterium]|jgi:NAD(P)-dependent dehydrogenase (short-subunit alcohol dehydrogenase family)|nr:SDR family oxidoreductase [Gammaproteobacteria bacterium]MBP6229554.1 SDR family oxidoreductase [Pseudomonadales bacterium]MBK6584584.1 SDR family oxidoreductase [Gammaproteobacteria bacterium]MBK7170887.1 SDR family oxidoreductase [Gammaproteobacteria bacterium]MBK7519907.1 SDR family oxidoreductase [Gammaproteobacteria bacterium]